MVKMYATGRRDLVKTSTPMAQVIPMITNRDTDTFSQCLGNMNNSLCMCVCVYVCMCVRVYVCMYVCM